MYGGRKLFKNGDDFLGRERTVYGEGGGLYMEGEDCVGRYMTV